MLVFSRYLSVAIILCSLLSALYAHTYIDLSLTTRYDSNVFLLSDSDFQLFDTERAFEYIVTSDDLINRVDIRLSHAFRHNNIRYTAFIRPTYTSFLQNSDKNNFSLLTGVNARWNRLSVNTAYGYYPYTYLRKYIDTDGTGENEKFEFARMMWRVSSWYRHNNLIIPRAELRAEVFHHNQYFTEYDGLALTTGLGWRFLTDYVDIDLMYFYRTFNTSSGNERIQYIIDHEKDGSHDSNIYEVQFRTKRHYHTITDYRLYLGARYEDRFYQSTIPLSLHRGRHDKTTTVNLGADLWFARDLSFNLDFQYRFRNVNSDVASVVRTKEYTRYQISSSIEWRFDLF